MAGSKGFVFNLLADTRQFFSEMKKGVIDPTEDAKATMDGLSEAFGDAQDSAKSLGQDGSNALGKVEDAAGDASSEVKDLGTDGSKALDKIEDAAGDASDDIKDLGGDASKALEKLEDAAGDATDEIKDIGTDGDKSLKKLEDALRDAQGKTEEATEAQKKLHQVVEDGSKTAYGSMARNAKDGYDKTNAAADDMKNEGKAAFGEMAGSFDGSMDSMAGSAQGFLGGLAASGGPIAMAAGAIALVAGSFYNSWKQKSEQTKNRIRGMYEDMMESNEDFLSEGYKMEEYWKILKGDEEAVLSLEKATEYAKKLGLEVEDVALAWAGNEQASRKFTEAAKRNIDEWQAKADGAQGEEKQRYIEQVSWSDSISEKWVARQQEIDDTTASVKKGRDAFKQWGQAGVDAAETKKGLVESIDQAYDDAAGAVDDFIDSESGVFNTKKYIDSMKKREKALKDYQENLSKAELSPEALDFLNSQGAEAAASMLQGYTDASPKQKRELKRIWSEAGRDASGVFDDKVQGVVDKTYKGPTMKPKIDDLAYRNELRRLQNETITIPVKLVTREGRFIP